MPVCDHSSGTIPVVNTILNNFVKAVNMYVLECFKNALSIRSEEQALFNLSLCMHFETSSSVISQFREILKSLIFSRSIFG